MAQTTHPPGTGGHAASGDGSNRRDFLYLATGAVGVVGAASAAWPFISSMNPAADTLALASIDVDLAPVAEGQAITVTWRGKPVFVRHRNAKEIEQAKTVNLGELRDPVADEARVKKPEWLIVVGICTHLGCVPLGQKVTDPRGDFEGWFCPCHGSHYDTAGRIRKGPAPANLVVPTYAFTSDTKIRLG
ncbi:ubiquinol-cytochrome c reductase iron-sulfur subunit [Azospirillum griseum]|uniref:Ubiquinol-cytochrome c reductase iron-sulfur subunit n=1 Tax=Azospirillum griseum TaxID=2496639 RepID=A0A3S0IH79_9PROT|nr:ubiquinol-cytochrome c reductase iron-sulfur subunit [Azospirillum griseum]RTR22901.1 ubiquinol-cytochrome c reductase iron-sulfur subunit [Azospirillum griseum]